MNKLNENKYIAGVHSETGIPEDRLKELWGRAEMNVEQQTEVTKGDPEFWSKVVKEFNGLVDNIDLQEASYIMNNRNDYYRSANDFVNSLLDSDYGKADEHYAKMVDARLRLMIDHKKEEFYKDELSKKANKLVSGE